MKLKWLLFFLIGAGMVFSTPLWSSGEKIPACMLNYKLGPEKHMIVVEKSTQSLFVYSNYQAEPVETFTITTGKNNGRKQVEGDLKTPEGLYFFKRTLSGNQLPKVDDYGEKAFTLNYPNPMDRKAKRNGSGIWLHGAFAADKTSNPNNSRGCVVMQNDDLVKLSKFIFLTETPICIYEKIPYDTSGNIQNKRDRLLEHLKLWRNSWEEKNIDGYISYYANDFKYNGMDKSGFKAHKNRLNKNYRFIKVTLEDVNLYGFKDYYVVVFNQLYISDINHFYSKKIQYWRNSGDAGKISAETTVKLPSINKFEFSKGNYISIAQFRRNHLKTLKVGTVSISPDGVVLSNISIRDGQEIKLVLKRSGSKTHLKAIPVLRLEGKGNSTYQSLPGVPMDDGVPTDYANGVRLESRQTTIALKKDKNSRMKSLTLFVVDPDKAADDKYQQIVTYFVN